ncbi:hypothetical protein AAVH_12383 [Aphelenchoides avenae]|nr:hypothetical protein AAVH_12383 [Aphelenchus avenae]
MHPMLQAAAFAALRNIFADNFLSKLKPDQLSVLKEELTGLQGEDLKVLFDELKKLLTKKHPEALEVIEAKESLIKAHDSLKSDDAKQFADKVGHG